MAPASGVGEIECGEAWSKLQSDPSAILVDVRTTAEWTFVGVPDLGVVSNQPIFLEWQSFPDGQVNAAFAQTLTGLLDERGAQSETNILFLCRSGSRSRDAARLMAAHGYTRCFNLSDGFEGPLNHERQRGRQIGWKAANLPWVQG